MKRFLILVIFFLPIRGFASSPPCLKWEFIVRSHEVQAYEKKDGTKVSEAVKKDHCKNKFPKVESWQERFTDGGVKDWPNKTEKFKKWTQLEKELVLKYLSEQPVVFRDLTGITFLRGIKSIYNKNPGATVKRLNAIALYDDFFTSGDKSQILSHELSHILIHQLKKNSTLELITLMGWRQNKRTKEFLRLDLFPLLKPDSKFDLSEDLANHFELFLQNPEHLQKMNKPVFEYIEIMMGTDFKLENQ